MINAFLYYKKQLFIVAGVVAVSSLSYGGYNSWRHRQDKKASDAYMKAVSLLEKLEESSKTQQAEEKQKQLQTLRQTFRQVRLDCPSCKVSRLAALNEAQLSLQLGKYQEAVATYQTVMQSCSHSKQLCAWAILGQARAQEAWNKQKEALQTLEQTATQWQQTPAEPFLQWYMVRLAYRLGENKKLQTYATKLQERFPNIWMSQQAKQLIEQSTTGENS